MLRELSAIGLSEYTGQRAAGKLIRDILDGSGIKGQTFFREGERYAEITKNMGPFQLVLRGPMSVNGNFQVREALPTIREKRGFVLLDWEIEEDAEGHIYVIGQEASCMEEIKLLLTDAARYFKNKAQVERQEALYLSIYGLSFEGKVLLGTYRTPDKAREIQENERMRRELLYRAYQGDESAREAIEMEEAAADEAITRRLQSEDVYSVYDGFFYPTKEENGYSLLGDIIQVEKLMNPFSEEWVYYLGLNVLGQLIRVLIAPADLTGEPKVGRRFQGVVRFYGRLDPTRLMLEDGELFF